MFYYCYHKMKKIHTILLSYKTLTLYLACFLLLLVHAAFIQANAVYAQADSISDSVLRLRVVANSDSKEDQAFKLAFKSRLCEILKPYLTDCNSADSAVKWIQENISFIQEQANHLFAGQPDKCTVQLTKSLFPTRTYGNLTFPPGNYRTLLVTLGEGQGHNWWCVLYPSLCFTDETTADFPEEAQKKLQKNLTESDYEALTHGVTFRFRIAEFLENHLSVALNH